MRANESELHAQALCINVHTSETGMVDHSNPHLFSTASRACNFLLFSSLNKQ